MGQLGPAPALPSLDCLVTEHGVRPDALEQIADGLFKLDSESPLPLRRRTAPNDPATRGRMRRFVYTMLAVEIMYFDEMLRAGELPIIVNKLMSLVAPLCAPGVSAAALLSGWSKAVATKYKLANAGLHGAASSPDTAAIVAALRASSEQSTAQLQAATVIIHQQGETIARLADRVESLEGMLAALGRMPVDKSPLRSRASSLGDMASQAAAAAAAVAAASTGAGAGASSFSSSSNSSSSSAAAVAGGAAPLFAAPPSRAMPLLGAGAPCDPALAAAAFAANSAAGASAASSAPSAPSGAASAAAASATVPAASAPAVTAAIAAIKRTAAHGSLSAGMSSGGAASAASAAAAAQSSATESTVEDLYLDFKAGRPPGPDTKNAKQVRSTLKAVAGYLDAVATRDEAEAIKKSLTGNARDLVRPIVRGLFKLLRARLACASFEVGQPPSTSDGMALSFAETCLKKLKEASSAPYATILGQQLTSEERATLLACDGVLVAGAGGAKKRKGASGGAAEATSLWPATLSASQLELLRSAVRLRPGVFARGGNGEAASSSSSSSSGGGPAVVAGHAAAAAGAAGSAAPAVAGGAAAAAPGR